MKTTKRKTRSETRSNNSQRAEMSIKKEEHSKVSLNQTEVDSSSTSDPIVKVEEKEADLKNQLENLGNEAGI